MWQKTRRRRKSDGLHDVEMSFWVPKSRDWLMPVNAHSSCGVFSGASKGFSQNTLKNLQVLKASGASAGRFVFLGFTASVQPFRGRCVTDS